MTDTITLPRAVGEKLREAHKCFEAAQFEGWEAAIQSGDIDRIRDLWQRRMSHGVAALDAALAELDVADLFAQFAAKQKPLDADMAAILHANLDSLYITDDSAAALAEPEQGNCADGSCNCCWTDKPDATREPATEEQLRQAHRGRGVALLPHFRIGWREAERFHGITKEDK